MVGVTKDAQGNAIGGVQITSSARSLTSVGGGTAGLTSGTTATSDASNGALGQFYIALPSATGYDIGLTPPAGSGGSTILLTNQSFTQNNANQTFTLTSATSLSGKVTFPDGTAAAGVQLTIGLHGDSSNITVVTDSSGNYSIGLAAGGYDIGLSDCTGKYLQGGCWFDTIYASNVTVGSTATTQNFVLPYSLLTGKVTDRNGVYISGVGMQASFKNLTSANAGGISQLTAGTSVVTDSSGNFSLGLPSNTVYQLLFTPTQGSNFKLQTIQNFNVTSSKQMAIILPFIQPVPPKVISGPVFNSINSTNVVVQWQTDQPTTGTATVGSVTVNDPTLATSHSVLVSGLTAATTYAVTVSAVNEAGLGPTTATGTVTTASVIDTSTPVIVVGPTVSGITSTGFLVTWITNKPSKGAVKYGTNDYATSASESIFSITHSVNVSGLKSATTYQLEVTAMSSTSSTIATSRSVSATTLAAPLTTPPVITNGPLISSITSTSASITWITDVPSVSGVSWNNGTPHGMITDTVLTTNHLEQLSGLTPNTTYYVTVSSTDALGNGPTLSKTVSFTTLPDKVVLPKPQILAPQSVLSVTNTTAMVTWVTDQASDSEVSYGTSLSSMNLSANNATLVNQHSVALVNLLPGQTYYVKVTSVNANGTSVNSYIDSFTNSSAVSFKTLSNPVTKAPIFQTPPDIGYATSNAAVIQWNTDTSSDTKVIVTNQTFATPPQVGSSGDLTTSHQLMMTNLVPSSTYSVSVQSTDISGNLVTKDVGTFSTPPTPGVVAPKIVQAPTVSTTASTATINWSTDILSDSTVIYTPANSTASQSAGDITYKKAHSVTIGNLSPGTSYSIKFKSKDPIGNSSGESVGTFTTSNADGTGGTQTAITTTTSTTSSTVASTTTTTLSSGSTGNTVTTYGGTNLSLTQGWNLVGNGYSQSFNVSSVFGNASSITSVWKWLSSSNQWAFYSPTLSAADLNNYASSQGYQALTTINPGDGFWVNSVAAQNVSINSGLPLASSNFMSGGTNALIKGWNLVSTGDNSTPSVFNKTLGTDVTSMWAWDSANSRWYFFAPSLSTAGTLSSYISTNGYESFGTSVLSPTTGFWVNKP